MSYVTAQIIRQASDTHASDLELPHGVSFEDAVEAAYAYFAEHPGIHSVVVTEAVYNDSLGEYVDGISFVIC